MRRSPLRSPPRMRGKAKNRCRSCPLTRITPACAGKRLVRLTKKPLPGDHPRVCGKKAVTRYFRLDTAGSPPRMRGKAVDGAGQSEGGEDHPRVCGEKLTLYTTGFVPEGSPPRMRGKDQTHERRHPTVRITPAYAGKSSAHNAASVIRKDHPRVCGEKSTTSEDAGSLPGSPPRMRGKGSRMTRATSMVGITPACAGKSARRQAGPPGPAPPPQMRSGWSPPPCTGRQCRTRKSTHARRARIPVPAHTPAPQ